MLLSPSFKRLLHRAQVNDSLAVKKVLETEPLPASKLNPIKDDWLMPSAKRVSLGPVVENKENCTPKKPVLRRRHSSGGKSTESSSLGEKKQAKLDFLPVIDESLVKWGNGEEKEVPAVVETPRAADKRSSARKQDFVEIPDSKEPVDSVSVQKQDDLVANDEEPVELPTPSMKDALILSPRSKNRPANVHRTTPNPKSKKSGLDNLPAHLKYRSLLKRSTLPLPQQYQVLLRMFEGLESVCAFYRGRNEEHLLQFHRIQKAVSNYCDRDFQVKHLAQILSVYPGAYQLSTCSTVINGQRQASFLISVTNDTENEESGTNAICVGIQLAKLNEQRKKHFTRLLVQRVYEAHSKFLESKNMKPLPLDGLQDWHPEFPIDSIADIEESESVLSVTQKDSAAKCLKELISIRPVIAETKIHVDKTDGSDLSQKDPSKMTVLERVRWKQQQKALQQMKVLTKEQSRELLALRRLDELVDRIDTHYSSHKKNSFYINELVKSLMGSMKIPLSEVELRELMILLNKTVSEWCNIIQTEFGTLVRVNRNSMSLKDVHVKIHAAMEKLKAL